MKPLNAGFVNTRKSAFYGESFNMALPPSNRAGYATFTEELFTSPLVQDEFPQQSNTFVYGKTSKIEKTTTSLPYWTDNFTGDIFGGYLTGSGKLVALASDNSSKVIARYSSDSGSTWTTVTSSYNFDASMLQGISPTACLLIDSFGTVVRFDGTSFSSSTISPAPNSPFPYNSKLKYVNGKFYFFSAYNAANAVIAVSTDDGSTWSYATDADLLNARAFDVTDSEKFAFIKDSYDGYLYSANSINGPWDKKPIPYSAEYQVTHIYDERLVISTLGLVTDDLGSTYKTATDSNMLSRLTSTPTACWSTLGTRTRRYIFNASYGVGTALNLFDSSTSFVSNIIELIWDIGITQFSSIFSCKIDESRFALIMSGVTSAVTLFAIVSIADNKSVVPVTARSLIGYKQHVVIGNVNPTKEIGCILSYKPDATYKLCDGFSSYVNADVRLKQKFPSFAVAVKQPPVTGYGGGSYNGISIKRLSYVNSTLVAHSFFSGNGSYPNDTALIYSTDSGSSWSFGTTLTNVSLFNDGTITNFDYDGTYYYVGFSSNDVTSQVARMTSLTGSYTATSWSSALIAVFIVCVSGSNTIALSSTGGLRAYQTTDQGASWSTGSLVYSSTTQLKRVDKISGTWYLVTNEGIFSTTDFSSYTAVSNTVGTGAYYESIAYNNGIWLASRTIGFPASQYVLERSTDSMTTWSVDKQTIGSILNECVDKVLCSIDGYFIDTRLNISKDGLVWTRFVVGNQQFSPQYNLPHDNVEMSGQTVIYHTDGGAPLLFTMTLDQTKMIMPSIPGMYMKITHK